MYVVWYVNMYNSIHINLSMNNCFPIYSNMALGSNNTTIVAVKESF